MPIPNDIIWEIQPHTKSKHEIFHRYLGAWFGIMGSNNTRILYIDGFCGPGRYKGGELGSPIIALKLALDHNSKGNIKNASFVFIDENFDRITHLKEEIKQLEIPSNFKLHIEYNQFKDALTKILNDIDNSGSYLAPVFAFLDPFGFKGLPYSLIQRLLQNDKTEIFINIMVDSINRFLKHPDPQIRKHIVDFFGTEDVMQIIEEDNRIDKLIHLYQKQLLKIAKYVLYFRMCDKTDRLIYCLFFATNNRLGHLKMKEAFWKVDPNSGFKYSDATNPDQLVLFQDDKSVTLANLLQRTFLNRKVIVKTIRIFVEDNTPFLSTHMKKALKHLEKEDNISVSETKQNGKKRRKGTFPDEVIITF